MRLISRDPSARIGLLLVLPFVLLDLVVANRFEPVLSWLRPAGHTTILEQSLLFGSLFLVALGGLVVMSPSLKKGVDGTRTFYLLNTIFGALFLTIALMLTFGFAEEVFRCDVLKIAACD